MTLILRYDKFKKTIIFVYANKTNPNPKSKYHVLFWMNLIFHRYAGHDQPLLNAKQISKSCWSSAPAGLGFGNLCLWVPPAWCRETSALSGLGCLVLGARRDRTSFWKQQLLLFPKHLLFNCAFFPPFFSQAVWHLKWSKFPVNHSFQVSDKYSHAALRLFVFLRLQTCSRDLLVLQQGELLLVTMCFSSLGEAQPGAQGAAPHRSQHGVQSCSGFRAN